MKKYLCLGLLFMALFLHRSQGQTIICTGASITLSAATSGGAWSSSNTTIATVSSATGLLTGVSAGIVTIFYASGAGTITTSVTVNPTPVLSVASTTPICDSSIFNYVPTSTVPGTSFVWNRSFVTGISNLPASGIGNPLEYLDNLTNSPIAVTYTYTLTASSCSSTQNVAVTVNPVPMLTSTLTPPAICDSFVFHYLPTSGTFGTIFSWYRPYIAGIYDVAETGSGDPGQQLINSTYVQVPVTYVYTLSAFGCTNTQNVTVTVNPTPWLSSTLTPPAICDTFSYLPTSFTPGATFAWDRPGVAGIIPATNFGTGNIHEVFYDSTGSPVVVSYLFRLGIAGCTNLYTESMDVTVGHCSPAGINNTPKATEGMNIYPNPSYGSFTIDLQNGVSNAIITISDVLGKIIETRKMNISTGDKEAFNLDYLPSGTYVINANADNGQTYRSKIVIW